MKTYLLKLHGKPDSLEMAKVFALRSFSYFRIVRGFAYGLWICETGSIEDVMEDVNISELERLGINIEFFG
jgi:hypothetical protein